MSRQTLSPDELLMVENQLDALSAPPTQATLASPSMPGPHAFQPQYALPSQQRPQQGPLPPNPGLQASLDSKNLADIIARAQRTPGPPQTPQASPQPQPTLTSHPSGQSAPVDLLASLRAKGLLPADSSTPVNDPAVYPPSSSVTNTPPVPPPGHQRSPSINDIELTSASLKRYVWVFVASFRPMLMTSRPRPYLISILYESRPNQCSTCGRRFLATEDGKQKKARHLDWHFRTNQRLADSAKRGQSRSWYVDELVRIIDLGKYTSTYADVNLGVDNISG